MRIWISMSQHYSGSIDDCYDSIAQLLRYLRFLLRLNVALYFDLRSCWGVSRCSGLPMLSRRSSDVPSRHTSTRRRTLPRCAQLLSRCLLPPSADSDSYEALLACFMQMWLRGTKHCSRLPDNKLSMHIQSNLAISIHDKYSNEWIVVLGQDCGSPVRSCLMRAYFDEWMSHFADRPCAYVEV